MIASKRLNLCTVLLAALLWACNPNANDELSHHDHNHGHEHGHEHSHEHGHEHEHGDHDGHTAQSHGGEEIVLEPETAKRFGVETETVKPGAFHQTVKVAGTVLPSADGIASASAQTAGIVTLAPGINVGTRVSKGQTIARISATAMSGGDANVAAKAALDAAKRELDRITPLHADGIVSTRQYNEALAAYEEAKAAYSPSASSGTVVAPISGVITSLDVTSGGHVDAGAQVAEISSSQKLTLRADLPARYQSFLPNINDARIVMPYTGETFTISNLGGSKSTSNNGVQQMAGYIPVYFTFDNPGGSATRAGAAVEVYLIGQSRNGVITVPVTAISEQQGDYFVYVKIDDECYQKVGVTPGLGDGERIEIVSGLAPGMNVVTKGVTTVRLAETSGVAPEGHSHNH